MKIFKKFNNWFDKNALKISVWLAVIVSVGSFLYFYFNNQWNLIYVDAGAHLNMARKVFDNLTPGIAQLGGLWLPLLHILMLPTIWINFMWQSGLSGYLVSGPAFVLSAYFIFKIVDLLFEDRQSAFLGVLIYMTNINILYLQTTAMMEPLFNLTIVGSIYFIVKWFKQDNILYLIVGGMFVSASTFTRYEGYGLLAFSWLAVVAMLFFKNRLFEGGMKRIEGNMFVFSTVAFLGVILWSGYLGAIFGNPLHWLHPNDNIVTTQEINVGETTLEKNVIKPDVPIPMFQDGNGKWRTEYYHNIFKTISYLWNATASSVGLLMLVLAVLGLIIVVYKIIRKKIHYSILIIACISLGTAFFLFVTMYLGKAAVWSPAMYGRTLLDRSQNFFDEAGIRYTLSLLPFVAIFASVISLGKWYKKILLSLLIIFQVGTMFIGPLFLTYNLPLKWKNTFTNDIPYVNWFKSNYKGGLIISSALTREKEMFIMGIEYKNYIHEGTGTYWKESLNNPAKYATWIIMQKEVGSGSIWSRDTVTKKIKGSSILEKNFVLLYDDNGTKIYKIKDKPEVDLLEMLGKK